MPTVTLTDEQKVKVRHHLGYPNIAEVATFALGVPAQVETAFIIERCMNKLLPPSRPELERLLAICDQCEQQMVDDLELLAVESVGEITVNQDEQRKLVARYDYWVDSLANFLGVDRNPFDKRKNGSGRGINVSVVR